MQFLESSAALAEGGRYAVADVVVLGISAGTASCAPIRPDLR